MPNPPIPKTLSAVRDACCQMYSDVLGDLRRATQVHEGSNALGKALAGCKIHLEYCELSKKKPTGDWKRFLTQ